MFSAGTWLYASPNLYRLVLHLLYGRYFEARYAAVAAEVPPGATVIDVCAGDCYLYHKYLRRKSVRYLGLDLSPQMVRWAKRQGIAAREFNLWQDDLPLGDIIVMQASLYQFMPDATAIVHKLLAAAADKVIIAEPIRNLSNSPNALLAGLTRRLTTPALAPASYAGHRFNRRSLTKFFHAFAAFERATVIPGGREMVGVFRGQHHPIERIKACCD